MVNILGTEYKEIVDEELGNSCDGYCDCYDKSIVIKAPEQLLDENETMERKNRRKNEVILHELIHAYMDESGLTYYSSDETLVEWIAQMFPKILKSYQEVKGQVI